MTVTLRGVTTVLLPGTGSDDDFVYRAFSAALHAHGATVVTPPPQPHRLVAGYREALDEAARGGPVAVGGVSIGAAVATAWALAHPSRAVGVLAALPAWTGSPQWAPAAAAARHSAELLRRDGIAAATATMRASSPPWLADELSRSWLGQWPALPDAMDEAAGYVAPTLDELGRMAVPMGIAGAVDDPVHPIEVAAEWVAAVPRAALRTLTLDELGADPAALGAACVAALLEA
ncbi:Alpha/beta hydrolase family protein [Mycolicibacterium rutilum]|uniref:Alpha/beta hydrolase family protein n=1 Tax=Mycolicibacterium rutilum TaxID=370526 RepID=A0A1H6LG92_MYCRU|nr:alpha/beta hydrolase [Mycolicibacterium rutilum]SEH83770.1 Alpha/beta hydrolase family protein [Mycolicibacterium rutilum]